MTLKRDGGNYRTRFFKSAHCPNTSYETVSKNLAFAKAGLIIFDYFHERGTKTPVEMNSAASERSLRALGSHAESVILKYIRNQETRGTS